MAGGGVPSNLAPIFSAAGKAYGIPPAVLAGISSVESNLFQNLGPSSAGATGGMQFLPSTARALGVNPNDPRSAIFGAAKLLVQYGYHQNPQRAIGAYNGGPGNPQMGYARQVISEARRLAPQLGGSGGGALGSMGLGGSPGAPGLVPVTTQSFDQAGFNAARARFVAGSAVRQADSSSNPFGATPGASAGFAKGLGPDSGALFANGLLSTTAPNPQNYVTAHTTLQQIAGTPLSLHPVLRAGTVAGGFLPKNATYIPGRKDRGRDGRTNPGGPIVANGVGVVVAVKSDPNGFGPAYPVVTFKSGPDAGKTIYFGHTLAAVRPGQPVRPGQVISRTGRQPVGNASVPGWFEIGLAPGGVPGPFGQPTPF